MRLLATLASAAALAVLSAPSSASGAEDKVLVLTDDTIDEALKSNPFILVEFYAPWCGHCKALEPEYKVAASNIEGYSPKVVLAKVDATENKKSAEQFGVQGFPTIKFFRNGVASDYGGGRTADTIVSWLKKKTGPATTAIASADALETFKKSGEVVVVGFFPTAEAAKAFEGVAQADDNVPYGTVLGASADVLKAMGATGDNTVVLFKAFDEGRADFKGDVSSEEAITKFVAGNQLPLIVPFNQKTAQKIFGGGIKQHVLLFLDAKNEAMTSEAKAAAKPVAEASRGEYLFVTIDKTDSRVMEFFGVTEKDMPTARVVEMGDAGMKKFKLLGDKVTSDVLTATLKAHTAKELKPDLKSEEAPEKNDGPVKVLTGKTFKSLVLDSKKDVFVEFYAPWCGHCKALAPKWDELGEKYKSNNGLMIAKMDATANEVDGVAVQGFPTLKLYTSAGTVVDYDGEREVEAMSKFLEENAASCKA